MRALRDQWLWVVGVLVSVVITFFSYPPHGLGPLMFVGLVPVFLAKTLSNDGLMVVAAMMLVEECRPAALPHDQ